MTPLPPPGAPPRCRGRSHRRGRPLRLSVALVALALALACAPAALAAAAAAGAGAGAGHGARDGGPSAPAPAPAPALAPSPAPSPAPAAAPDHHLSHRAAARLRSRGEENPSGGVMDQPAKEGELADGGPDATTTVQPQGGCSSCMIREGLRNLSLNAIKEQILNKLGMKHAPNMTGRHFPKIPRIHQHLLDMYRLGGGGGQHGMQGDEPAASSVFKTGPVVQDEEDDFHARMEKVIAFAQPSSALPREYACMWQHHYLRATLSCSFTVAVRFMCIGAMAARLESPDGGGGI